MLYPWRCGAWDNMERRIQGIKSRRANIVIYTLLLRFLDYVLMTSVCYLAPAQGGFPLPPPPRGRRSTACSATCSRIFKKTPAALRRPMYTFEQLHQLARLESLKNGWLRRHG